MDGLLYIHWEETRCVDEISVAPGHSMLLQDTLFPLLFGHKSFDHHTEHRGTGCFWLRVLCLLLHGNVARYHDFASCSTSTAPNAKYHDPQDQERQVPLRDIKTASAK